MIKVKKQTYSTTSEAQTTSTPSTDTQTTGQTANTPVTEAVIYYVLGEGGRDRAYLVHIELSVLERYRDAEIERAVTGTHHVRAILPEHYDGEITTEATVTVDDDGKLSVFYC